MEVSALPNAVAHHLFPELIRMLVPAADGKDVFVESRDTLWVAYEGNVAWGAATTYLRDDGVVRLRLAGGRRFKDWMGPLDEAVEQWARRRGLTRIVMRGRAGWRRYADRYGWAVLDTDQHGKVNFEKRLDREGK